jgi:hypothetical protein
MSRIAATPVNSTRGPAALQRTLQAILCVRKRTDVTRLLA